MARISETTRRILAQNAGRDPERLVLKYRLIRRDPFAFFRGTNPLFLEFLPRRSALLRAPCTLISGDLHLENFGAFKGDNRLCYFDVNDFDEACLGPFTLDLVRFAASVEVAAGSLALSRHQAQGMIEAFLGAYAAAIADGKPRWIERTLAQGVFRTLLRRATNRTRLELLDRFTKCKGDVRRFRIDGVRGLAIDPGERQRLKRLLKSMGAAGPDPAFFAMIDAARRIAGNGSLGLARDMLLVRGRRSPDQNFILDLKIAAPSAVAAWRGLPQPAWHSEAERVVAIQRIVQAIPPAMLAAVNFERQPFVLKELQPSIDRLDLARWQRKPRRILQALQGMGRVTAWGHLRGCGRFGADSVETLAAFVAAAGWRPEVERAAGTAARRVETAWRRYAADYDRGAVPGAQAP